MRFPWIRHGSGAPPAHLLDMTRLRRDALAHAAVELAAVRGDAAPDAVLRITVEAAARITGASVALALATGDGRLERFAAHGLDGCTRDTLARADVLGALVGRLRTLARPVAPEDLDPATARMLLAVAPHGVVIFPVDASGLLIVAARAEGGLDADALGVVTVLARLAAAALDRARELTSLEEACAELRRLSGQVLARRDEELGRTARELHEGICQRLAAVNAQLEALGSMVEGQRAPLARLRDARGLVNQAVGELRELAQRLRPSVLENLGYVEALRWYVGRLRERSGIALSLEVEGGETRLPLEMESALYRATEEALGAASDAEASRWLRIRYRREPAAVRVQIAGSPPGAVDLVAIRERLRPFGGAVEVTDTPGDTPVIEVQVPTN